MADLHGTVTAVGALDATIASYGELGGALGALSKGTMRLVIDDALSDTSKNPVQNRVITAALKEIAGMGLKDGDEVYY